MSSSITKRWVRGSLFFTLAVLLVAEGVFLYYTINGYYSDVQTEITNQFTALRTIMLSPTPDTADGRSQRLIQTVEDFGAKSQFELMLVNVDGSIGTTSSGILPQYSVLQPDIEQALTPGGTASGYYVGETETGERVMAITVRTPYSAHGVVAMRLVTSLTLIDETIAYTIAVSVAVLFLILLASILSGVFFIRSIVFPLRKVEATAALIARGNFETRIESRTDDEIGSLCKTINNMADELSRTEQMKNDFISSVSHELRTPLTSIKGWAETIGSMNSTESPGFKRGMQIISGETDRLYNMVEELLDFSRMQNGITLNAELLDMAAEVEEAVLLSHQSAAAQNITLSYEAPQLPVPVMADKNRVRQVMVNILDNAIKYSRPSGNIEITVKVEADEVIIEVADQGQGISPQDLENVKIKFFKGSKARRGSGIGLAVVDEIMKAHDGNVTLTSLLNHGTTAILSFKLYSPIKGETR